MLIKLGCKPLLGLGWDWTGGSECLYPWVWRHIPKPVLLTSTPPADDPMRPAPVTHPGRTSARSAPDRGTRLLGASSPASSPPSALSALAGTGGKPKDLCSCQREGNHGFGLLRSHYFLLIGGRHYLHCLGLQLGDSTSFGLACTLVSAIE